MENTQETWWQDVLAKCSDYGISQKRLATFAGISIRHFIRLKKGENVLTKPLKAAIDKALKKLNPNAPLNLIIDYVRIRFPTTDVCHVVNKIMKLGITHMIHEDYAHNGYEESYCLGDITISVSQNIKLGCLIEMKGAGCRQFEGILEAQERNWYDFFLLSLNEGGKFKRLDLAINDVYGILDIGELTRKWENKECVSKFGSYNYYRSGKAAYKDEKDCMGETLYIGSRKSEIYFCIYAKDYEQFIKHGIPMEEAPVKNRFEIRLKNERAYIAVDDLLTYRDAEHTAFEIINNYVRFLDFKNPDCDEETLDPTWEYFIGEYREKLKLTTAPAKISMVKKLNWLSHQVAPSIKMVKELDTINGTNYMEQIYEDAKLSEKHLKLLEQASLSAKELIFEEE